jgi:DNA modification methylase
MKVSLYQNDCLYVMQKLIDNGIQLIVSSPTLLMGLNTKHFVVVEEI